MRTLTFVVRTSVTPTQVASEVRRVLANVDGSLPVFALRNGDDVLSASTAPQRFNTFVVVMFAVFAVSLAATGLYALMAYMVALSSRELPCVWRWARPDGALPAWSPVVHLRCSCPVC